MVNKEENIIIHPTKGKKEKPVPGTGLLLVNPTEAAGCQKRLKGEGGKGQYLFNSELVIDEGKDFFVAGPAIGAPMAVMTMEKLIALGAKRLILFGWCGAISKELAVGDVLVPESAFVGEGTSQYYSETMAPLPSSQLRKKISKLLERENIAIKGSRVWSTDAIYREDRQTISQLHKEKNVDAVDMEFSALCSVAQFRKIEFAAVLIVSDELWGKSWRPGFTASLFQNNKKRTLDALLGNIEDLHV